MTAKEKAPIVVVDEAALVAETRARAQELLGPNDGVDGGVDLYIQSDDTPPGARYVHVRITHVLLEFILQHQGICSMGNFPGNLPEMTSSCVPTSWYRDQRRGAPWELKVDALGFQFEQLGLQSGIPLSSRRVPLEALLPLLNSMPPHSVSTVSASPCGNETSDEARDGTGAERFQFFDSDRFRWVGGCLLLSRDPDSLSLDVLDAFVADIISECPEVAAMETTIRMAARIAEAAGDRPDHAEVSLAPVRRRRVVV